MSVAEIREILETPYDRKIWKGFLKAQFTNNKLNAEDRIILLSDKTISKQCLSLGNYEIGEYAKIGIFEIELNENVNITRSRVALRNLIKDLTQQVAGAMVVFVQGSKWRFSYISKRKVKNKDTNEIQDKETAPKRYTYLFGKGEKALTAAIRFDRLILKQKDNLFDLLSLDDFEEAFSVEKLSKEFFANYKETYEDFVQFLTGKRYTKKGGKYTEVMVHEPDWQFTALFGKDEKQARDFVKRMMGRIVFLYFIQKKGWLSIGKGKKWGEGNQNYMYDLFKNSKQQNDFYALELAPLFFNRLNNEDSENAAREERFPYLNGGLFDDTQDKKYCKLYLNEQIFEKMFEHFNNYNFTIYEDAPDEHTVAVDPEMLGHIFENLLEDNKDKGAFYTPKDIVHFMCKESLKTYLFAHDEKLFADSDVAKETFDKIIQQQELSYEEKSFAEKNAYKIIDALERVKICDPAIGSGAFPMGLLQEIFNAQIYLQELKGFKKGVTDADIKKHIIEESIYGVDIDAGAVDIARLRFWLSLVVDEQEPQPLPNLDFKIVCANTLIPLGKLTGLDMQAKASLAVKELEKIRHDFFNVSSESKLNLERQFKKVQTDLLNLRELTTKDNYEIYTKLYEFSPFDFESLPCSWFDPWWMFGVKDGFDIVIGNPPYVQLQKNGGTLSNLYGPKKVKEANKTKVTPSPYETFDSMGDIYSLFYEKGWQILKPNGVLCFITSNKWMRAGYGESTRKFLSEKTNPVLLIDFAGQKVFDNATVDVNILMFTKGENQQKTLACIVKENVLNNLSVFVRQQGTECNFSTRESWTILSPIEQSIKRKIEALGTPLKDWDINISRGILTGYNEAFIIDENKKNELVAADPKSAEIIRPILRGRDIKRYGYDFADLWLINTHNGVKEKGIKRININDYPAIKKHLDCFWNDIAKRTDQGDTPYNLRNCAYTEDFFRQKIIWKIIGNQMAFSIDSNSYIVNNACYILTGSGLKYLLSVLNSKTITWYSFITNMNKTGVGDVQVGGQNVNLFPIPLLSETEQKPFVDLVEKIIKEKEQNKDTSILEKKIQNLVNELYGFTKKETDFIESQ